jgi:hypothetical protein
MNAFLKAFDNYEAGSMWSIFYRCASHGFVYSDCDAFLCAIPIMRQNLNNDNEIESKLDLDKCDTWFVYIASGNLNKLFGVIPKKKYVAYERFDGKIRVFDFDKLRGLVNG